MFCRTFFIESRLIPRVRPFLLVVGVVLVVAAISIIPVLIPGVEIIIMPFLSFFMSRVCDGAP